MAALARTLGRAKKTSRISKHRVSSRVPGERHGLNRSIAFAQRPFFFSLFFALFSARVCLVVSADADLLARGVYLAPQTPRRWPESKDARARVPACRAVVLACRRARFSYRRCSSPARRSAFMHDASRRRGRCLRDVAFCSELPLIRRARHAPTLPLPHAANHERRPDRMYAAINRANCRFNLLFTHWE